MTRNVLVETFVEKLIGPPGFGRNLFWRVCFGYEKRGGQGCKNGCRSYDKFFHVVMYPSSPCSLMSRPCRSISGGIRRPISRLTIAPIIALPTTANTIV